MMGEILCRKIRISEREKTKDESSSSSSSHTCEVCKMEFPQLHHLNWHRKKSHWTRNSTDFQCKVPNCDYKTGYNGNWGLHQRRHQHNSNSNSNSNRKREEGNSNSTCWICHSEPPRNPSGRENERDEDWRNPEKNPLTSSLSGHWIGQSPIVFKSSSPLGKSKTPAANRVEPIQCSEAFPYQCQMNPLDIQVKISFVCRLCPHETGDLLEMEMHLRTADDESCCYLCSVARHSQPQYHSRHFECSLCPNPTE
jgi:hypothetical protein